MEWKQGDAKNRGTMVNELIEKKILPGKKKIDIEELLGQPDESTEKEYIYFLETDFMGRWRRFLHIEFIDSNIVSSAWVND